MSVIRTRLAELHQPVLATFVDAKLFKWPTPSVSGLTLPVVWQLKTQDNFSVEARAR